MIHRPLLDHAEIAARIPHAGTMCLLDTVVSWDMRRIVCRATGHRAADHPLRGPDSHLGIAAGIEYAAQAMAVHGSLLAEQASRNDSRISCKPPPGLLASVRSVQMHARWLSDSASDLQIEATQIASDAQALVYAFEVYGCSAIDCVQRSRDVSETNACTDDQDAGSPRKLLLNGRASVMLLVDAS